MNTIQDIIFFLFIFPPFQCYCLETDTISSNLVIKDPDTIVSHKQIFKLGFFTPDNTTNRYLGIFFASSEKTVVWIANRDNPLHDSSGTVTISRGGNLVLLDGRNRTVWSTNATTSPVNTTVRLQDNGNLVLLDDATGTPIWESFSQPTDVFMRSMKLSHNARTGKKVTLSAWKNDTDPEAGRFTSGVEAFSLPQSFIWDNGRPRWRGGSWNGQIYIGVEYLYLPHLFAFSEVKSDGSGTFYEEAVGPSSIIVRLKPTGRFEVMLWDDRKKSWDIVYYSPRNECDLYGRCGPFGRCDIKDSPICSCLRGFEPTDKDEWERGNWTGGCRRKNQLQCGAGGSVDGFSRLQYVKVPDFPQVLSSRQEDDCMTVCSRNCSCIAYAHEPKIGCMFWSDTLIDIQMFNGVGVDLYVRLSASEFGNHQDKKLYIIIPVVVASGCILIFIFIAWCWMVKKNGSKKEDKNIFEVAQTFSSDSTAIVLKQESEKVNIGELPHFNFEMLANATAQFCQNNLLGRGGFGSVYMGILENGKEIAVKRLSMASRQGTQEFMNEVIVISKLQHRNLVRLLGCCVEKEEKLLIYEYMPNKSLDVCFFDPTHPSKKVLDWTKRFSIIQGIGRGLLYLHRDSRLRIIHRDLKPSNVLLDEDWNPKISDFGMAKIFGGDQDHDNTARVVGTYGYMAPEYAMEGRFSEKSDVYSFGVLMLELVKGEKNTHYYNHELSLSLLGCAWQLWSEGNGLAFADESIASLDFQEEIVRCIQIALLCVQESPNDRPNIQVVLSMLSHEIVDLPAPGQPVFNDHWEGSTTGQTLPADQAGHSINELTVTVLDGR